MVMLLNVSILSVYLIINQFLMLRVMILWLRGVFSLNAIKLTVEVFLILLLHFHEVLLDSLSSIRSKARILPKLPTTLTILNIVLRELVLSLLELLDLLRIFLPMEVIIVIL